MPAPYTVYTYGYRLKIQSLKLDQRDCIFGCVLIESYLKNNINLTGLRDEKNINIFLDFSPWLYTPCTYKLIHNMYVCMSHVYIPLMKNII